VHVYALQVTVRMSDGSTMTLPPPSFVASALERLGVGRTATSFLDVGCGTGYVTALAACLIGDVPGAQVQVGLALDGYLHCISLRLTGTLRMVWPKHRFSYCVLSITDVLHTWCLCRALSVCPPAWRQHVPTCAH
jgi:SAM-dependent methyltransferase